MKIDEKANKENVKLFKRYGIMNRNNIYTCVCCGKKTCIDCSTSIEGAYLVCHHCVNNYFSGNIHNCMGWQDDMMSIAQDIYEWRKELKNDK